MEIITISKTYKLKWVLKSNYKYKWSECGKLFNTKTNREVKKIVVGSTKGYCIDGKFRSLDSLRKELELIPKKVFCPF